MATRIAGPKLRGACMGTMKTYIRKQKVHTVDDLKKAANDYWNSLETCARYVEGVQWRMKRVIEERGKNIVENK